MARGESAEWRISVRLRGELVSKIKQWERYGISMSDTVRLALSLLPSSPDKLQESEPHLMKIKPLQKSDFEVKPKDEKEALKVLQEW